MAKIINQKTFVAANNQICSAIIFFVFHSSFFEFSKASREKRHVHYSNYLMLMMMMAELRVCSEKKIGHETMNNIIIPRSIINGITFLPV